MQEPASAVAATTGSGAATISIPFLAALGLDAGALIFGLIGCVIAQCLLPDRASGVKQVALVTIGSTLVAGVFAPIAAQYLVTQLTGVQPVAAIKATATLLGIFAQPALVIARDWIMRKLAAKLSQPAAPTPGPQSEK